MSNNTQRQDVDQLVLDVALTKQKVEYIEKSVISIEKKIDTLSFVPRKEYDEFRSKVESDIQGLKEINQKNYIGTFFANLLGSKALTLVAGGLLLAAVYFIAKGGI